MSNHAEKAKAYFEQGRWNAEMLHALAGKGYITSAEYEEITGQKYE